MDAYPDDAFPWSMDCRNLLEVESRSPATNVLHDLGKRVWTIWSTMFNSAQIRLSGATQ